MYKQTQMKQIDDGLVPSGYVLVRDTKVDSVEKKLEAGASVPGSGLERLETVSLLRSKGFRRSQGMGSAGGSLPPSIPLFPPRRFRMLYKITADYSIGSPLAITVGRLLGMAGALATTTSNTTTIHSTCKVCRVTIWPDCSTTEPDNYSVFWFGDGQNIPDESKATTIPKGVTVTKSVSFTPPAKSLATFWWTVTDSATNLFDIVCRTGSVVGIEWDVTQGNQIALFNQTGGGASLSVGTLYYQPIDNSSSNPIGIVNAHQL